MCAKQPYTSHRQDLIVEPMPGRIPYNCLPTLKYGNMQWMFQDNAHPKDLMSCWKMLSAFIKAVVWREQASFTSVHAFPSCKPGKRSSSAHCAGFKLSTASFRRYPWWNGKLLLPWPRMEGIGVKNHHRKLSWMVAIWNSNFKFGVLNTTSEQWSDDFTRWRTSRRRTEMTDLQGSCGTRWRMFMEMRTEGAGGVDG